jgi:hypothetical protein
VEYPSYQYQNKNNEEAEKLPRFMFCEAFFLRLVSSRVDPICYPMYIPNKALYIGRQTRCRPSSPLNVQYGRRLPAANVFRFAHGVGGSNPLASKTLSPPSIQACCLSSANTRFATMIADMARGQPA